MSERDDHREHPACNRCEQYHPQHGRWPQPGANGGDKFDVACTHPAEGEPGEKQCCACGPAAHGKSRSPGAAPKRAEPYASKRGSKRQPVGDAAPAQIFLTGPTTEHGDRHDSNCLVFGLHRCIASSRSRSSGIVRHPEILSIRVPAQVAEAQGLEDKTHSASACQPDKRSQQGVLNQILSRLACEESPGDQPRFEERHSSDLTFTSVRPFYCVEVGSGRKPRPEHTSSPSRYC